MEQIKPYFNESTDTPIVVVMQLIGAHRFRGYLSHYFAIHDNIKVRESLIIINYADQISVKNTCMLSSFG